MTADPSPTWKPYLGAYEVSDRGDIRRVRVLRPRVKKNRNGEHEITVVINGKRITRTVHKIVLEAFVGPAPPGLQCRHLNGRPDDNRVENLCWGTPMENANDKREHGTIARGNALPFARLTADLVREIRASPETAVEIAARIGVSRGCINNVRQRRSWAWVK